MSAASERSWDFSKGEPYARGLAGIGPVDWRRSIRLSSFIRADRL